MENLFPFFHFLTTNAKLSYYFSKKTHFCTKISENLTTKRRRDSNIQMNGSSSVSLRRSARVSRSSRSVSRDGQLKSVSSSPKTLDLLAVIFNPLETCRCRVASSRNLFSHTNPEVSPKSPILSSCQLILPLSSTLRSQPAKA
jgi:hypothetical protein